MSKTQTEKQKIRERAIFDIEMLLDKEEEAKNEGVEYLKSITEHSARLTEMMKDERFTADNLRADTISWVTHYSKCYTESMMRVELIRQSRLSLKTTLDYLKEENN